MYYKSNCTDKIFTENQIKAVNNIYGESEFDEGISAGVFVPIENPSVIDFIKCDNMAGAIHRYRELHDCKVKEAYDAVYAMRRDIRRFQKNNKNKEKK